MATGSLCHLQGWKNSRKSLDTGLKAQGRSPAELEIRAQGEGAAKLLPSGTHYLKVGKEVTPSLVIKDGDFTSL